MPETLALIEEPFEIVNRKLVFLPNEPKFAIFPKGPCWTIFP
jgi:hypothetical protein